MRSTQNINCLPYATAQTPGCQSVRVCKYQTCLKAMFRMSSVCLNASSKTWMPLLDHFVSNCPLPGSTRCHASFRWRRLCQSSTTILLKCRRLVGKFRDEFLAQYPFSCPNTWIKTWSFAENTTFTVYMIAEWVTEWLQYAVLETAKYLSLIFKDW